MWTHTRFLVTSYVTIPCGCNTQRKSYYCLYRTYWFFFSLFLLERHHLFLSLMQQLIVSLNLYTLKLTTFSLPCSAAVTSCAFGNTYFCQPILLFNLFLLLFMSLTAFFGTIHGSHCTISTNFYFYL